MFWQELGKCVIIGQFFSRAKMSVFYWHRVFALRGLESLRNTTTSFIAESSPRRAQAARPGVLFSWAAW